MATTSAPAAISTGPSGPSRAARARPSGSPSLARRRRARAVARRRACGHGRRAPLRTPARSPRRRRSRRPPAMRPSTTAGDPAEAHRALAAAGGRMRALAEAGDGARRQAHAKRRGDLGGGHLLARADDLAVGGVAGEEGGRVGVARGAAARARGRSPPPGARPAPALRPRARISCTSSASAGDDDTPVERMPAACTRFGRFRSMPIRYPGSDAGRLAANVLIAHRRSSSGTSRRAAAKIASSDAASTARSLRSVAVARRRPEQQRPVRRRHAVDAAALGGRDAAHDRPESRADLAVEQPVLTLPRPGRERLSAGEPRDRVGLDPGGIHDEPGAERAVWRLEMGQALAACPNAGDR